MEDKLWLFADEKTGEVSPYDYLKKAAKKLSEDTEDMFHGDVMQNINDDGKIICSFYLVVPKLRNYTYRLIEIVQPSFDQSYPVEMSLFGTAVGNIVRIFDVTEKDFENQLNGFIGNPLTRHILLALKTQLEIYKDYSNV